MNDARQICVAFSSSRPRVARYASDVSAPAHVGGHMLSEPLPVPNSSNARHTCEDLRGRYNHKLLPQLSMGEPRDSL